MIPPFLAARLASQALADPRPTPAAALAWLLAVQGQDLPGALWTLGLRSTPAAAAGVEQALARREIVRTWALRGTLHLVHPPDLPWLLALLGPLQIERNARRYRELELDEPGLRRSADVLTAALAGGRSLNRPALFAILQQHGISTAGQRGVYMLQYASLLGRICQGPAPRNQPTFYRIDEALPPAPPRSQDDALAELAGRYFAGRGPATIQDFAWWSGLPMPLARQAFAAVRAALEEETQDGRAYYRLAGQTPPALASFALLLPGFDEYLLSYTHRTAILDPATIRSLTPSNGMPPNTILIDGQVVGVWKRAIKKKHILITLRPFRPLTSIERALLEAAANRYAAFLEKPAVLDLLKI